ncbi:MAG: helix-turn-helix transcriptional regulator [Desulfobulbaceae bacterium]|jgi:transcriptional regulator with XRE-family HTH domain|nr:helix-turn-helix transcriptional regulator [Desulfobulbaceae bacterium]
MNSSSSVDINGNKIRMLREQKELTQLYLATVVGVTTDTISRWENRRYPTIKLENAKKLAEALGVPLEELLDGKGQQVAGDDLEGTPEEPGPAAATAQPITGGQHFLRRYQRWLGFCGGLLFVVAAGSFFFLSGNRSGVTTERILPQHTAPNLPFPVIVQVTGAADSINTLLLREELLGDCEAIGSSPEGESPKHFGKNPRWIGKLVNGRATFLYMVQPGKKLRQQEELRFKGDLIVGEGLTIGEKIGGADHIELAPYHWVDTDRDYVISDSEILKAHETYALPGENLINFAAIEELWVAGKYTLNKKTLTFVPANQANSKE